jgi:hypothetical protein
MEKPAGTRMAVHRRCGRLVCSMKTSSNLGLQSNMKHSLSSELVHVGSIQDLNAGYSN